MTTFRLQTFSPTAADDEAAAPPPPPITERDLMEARELAYRDGFLAGQAAAEESHAEDQSKLTAAIVEALDDARLTNEAARRHVVASFAPMVGGLVAALTAALGDVALQAEIVERVRRALAAVNEARPRLRIAPEVAGTMRAILAEKGFAIEIEETSTLLPREAELHWDEGFDRIDVDACAREIAACVARHLEFAPRGEEGEGGSHG